MGRSYHVGRHARVNDGQEPRQRGVDRVIREIVELGRLGFRFIALADDNFYPVTFGDLAQAKRRADGSRLRELEALRAERFALMAQLAELPDALVFYTRITMEAAEDPAFLRAMRRAKIRGALVGVESVTADALKDVYKGFYSWRHAWARSRVVESIRARTAFVLISKLYRQIYANTGIATDSARVQRSTLWAGWIGYACRRLFPGKPMPNLAIPGAQLAPTLN